MRLITFSYHGHARLGVILARDGQERVLDLSRTQPGLPVDMVAFLAAGETTLVAARNVMASATERDLLPVADVTLLAPVPRPGKIVCLGHNYTDHMGIGKTEPPEYPTFFCKTTNTIIGPSQAIIIPCVTSQVDYEAELAVVIGKRARRVAQEHARPSVRAEPRGIVGEHRGIVADRCERAAEGDGPRSRADAEDRLRPSGAFLGGSARCGRQEKRAENDRYHRVLRHITSPPRSSRRPSGSLP